MHRTGYGILQSGGRHLQAHRVAFELCVGEPGPLYVCHHCDNPPCVNPGHLFLGTLQENSDDKIRKGRQAKGATNGRSSLTESEVLEIRSGTTSLSELAERYGVSLNAVWSVYVGRTWKHVPATQTATQPPQPGAKNSAPFPSVVAVYRGVK